MESVKSRVSGRRVVAEFAVIVAGVLVALAVDEWAQSQRDERAEVTYVQRLIQDVQADTAELSGALVRGREKDARLRRLMSLTEGELARPEKLSMVAEDLQRSQGWGWEYPTARTVTLDEILSIGALDLVRDPDVRRAINDYYWWHEDTEDRVEARRSDLPAVAYSLLVPAADHRAESMSVSPDDLRASIRSGELHRAARGELNFTHYQMSATEALISVAVALLQRLESYLEGLR